MVGKKFINLYLILLFFLFSLTVSAHYLILKKSKQDVRLAKKQTKESLNSLLDDEINKLERRIIKLKIKPGSKKYTAHLKGIIEKFRLGHVGYSWVIDNNGRLVIYSEDTRILIPEYLKSDKTQTTPIILKLKQGILFKEEKGTQRVVIFKQLKNTPYYLAITYPVKEINFPIASYLKYLWFVFILLGVVSFFSVKNYEDKFNKFLRKIEADMKAKLRAYKEKERNSISGLPGSSQLQKILFEKIDSGGKLAVGLVDSNNLAAFNHKYSFEKGDAVIRQVATIVTNKVKEYGNIGDFVAHIGGDQFVFATSIDKAEKICQEIIRSFDEQIPYYYNKEDKEKGFILSKDRFGNIHKFSLMTVSIGVVTNEKRVLIHPLQIGQITMELRNYLRKRKESSYVIDRRLKEREEE